MAITDEQKQRAKQARDKYRAKPEAKLKQREYNARPETKASKAAHSAAYRAAREADPDYKKRVKDVRAKYCSKPEIKAKQLEQKRNRASSIAGVFKSLQSGALTRGIDFLLTLEEFSELVATSNMVCAISGVPLSLQVGHKHKLSGDRKDSSLGYTRTNVQIVSAMVNFMKQDYSQDEFISLCRKITEHNQ
jgi:hypothetical protein